MKKNWKHSKKRNDHGQLSRREFMSHSATAFWLANPILSGMLGPKFAHAEPTGPRIPVFLLFLRGGWGVNRQFAAKPNGTFLPENLRKFHAYPTGSLVGDTGFLPLRHGHLVRSEFAQGFEERAGAAGIANTSLFLSATSSLDDTTRNAAAALVYLSAATKILRTGKIVDFFGSANDEAGNTASDYPAQGLPVRRMFAGRVGDILTSASLSTVGGGNDKGLVAKFVEHTSRFLNADLSTRLQAQNDFMNRVRVAGGGLNDILNNAVSEAALNPSANAGIRTAFGIGQRSEANIRNSSDRMDLFAAMAHAMYNHQLAEAATGEVGGYDYHQTGYGDLNQNNGTQQRDVNAGRIVGAFANLITSLGQQGVIFVVSDGAVAPMDNISDLVKNMNANTQLYSGDRGNYGKIGMFVVGGNLPPVAREMIGRLRTDEPVNDGSHVVAQDASGLGAMLIALCQLYGRTDMARSILQRVGLGQAVIDELMKAENQFFVG